MTEGVEQALETIAAGVFFCMAVTMLVLLHTAFLQQVSAFDTLPERLILFEETEEELWRHSEE